MVMGMGVVRMMAVAVAMAVVWVVLERVLVLVLVMRRRGERSNGGRDIGRSGGCWRGGQGQRHACTTWDGTRGAAAPTAIGAFGLLVAVAVVAAAVLLFSPRRRYVGMTLMDFAVMPPNGIIPNEDHAADLAAVWLILGMDPLVP